MTCRPASFEGCSMPAERLGNARSTSVFLHCHRPSQSRSSLGSKSVGNYQQEIACRKMLEGGDLLRIPREESEQLSTTTRGVFSRCGPTPHRAQGSQTELRLEELSPQYTSDARSNTIALARQTQLAESYGSCVIFYGSGSVKGHAVWSQIIPEAWSLSFRSSS